MKTASKKIKLKKMDKKTEEIFKASTVAVLLENMNDNFKILAEGQMGLERRMNEKFDQIDTRLDRMDTRLDRIDTRFDRVDADFKEVKANQKITLEYLFNAEERF